MSLIFTDWQVETMMSKLMKTMITSLVILLAGAITALVIVINISTPEKVSGEQSIDDMVEYSFESPEVTTDLEDGAFVRVQFQIIADSSDAKKELEKRDFQLKNILIKELAKKNKEPLFPDKHRVRSSI